MEAVYIFMFIGIGLILGVLSTLFSLIVFSIAELKEVNIDVSLQGENKHGL